MAKNIARHVVVAEGDPSVMEGERRQIVDALNLADLWLNEATALPSGVSNPQAWSRSGVDREDRSRSGRNSATPSPPAWSRPWAARSAPPGLPAEAQAMAGPLMGMMKQMGGMMVGQQIGQAIGSLAREVVGSTDIGLPLSDDAALLPGGIAAFSEGLDTPAEEIRLYLALREAAHHRLFQHVPWLRAHLLGAVEEYARGITVDASALEEQLRGLDINNPEQLQQALSGGNLLKPEETERQKAAPVPAGDHARPGRGLGRHGRGRRRRGQAPVFGRAVGDRAAPQGDRGPAEQTFATLVGLELRPRRLREAAALWQALEAAGVSTAVTRSGATPT